jgi:hypothetical protein
MEYWDEIILIPLLSTHYSIVPAIQYSIVRIVVGVPF